MYILKDMAYRSTSSFFGFVSEASEVLSSDAGAAASDVGAATSDMGAATSDMGVVVFSVGAASARAKMTEWYVSPAAITFAYSLSLIFLSPLESHCFHSNITPQ